MIFIYIQRIEVSPSISHRVFLNPICKSVACRLLPPPDRLCPSSCTWSLSLDSCPATEMCPGEAGPSPHHSKARHQTTLAAAQRGFCQRPSSRESQFSSPPVASVRNQGTFSKEASLSKRCQAKVPAPACISQNQDFLVTQTRLENAVGKQLLLELVTP